VVEVKASEVVMVEDEKTDVRVGDVWIVVKLETMSGRTAKVSSRICDLWRLNLIIVIIVVKDLL